MIISYHLYIFSIPLKFEACYIRSVRRVENKEWCCVYVHFLPFLLLFFIKNICTVYIHISLTENAWGSLINCFLVANTKFSFTSFSSGKIKCRETFDIFKKIDVDFHSVTDITGMPKKQHYKNNCYNTSNN